VLAPCPVGQKRINGKCASCVNKKVRSPKKCSKAIRKIHPNRKCFTKWTTVCEFPTAGNGGDSGVVGKVIEDLKRVEAEEAAEEKSLAQDKSSKSKASKSKASKSKASKSKASEAKSYGKYCGLEYCGGQKVKDLSKCRFHVKPKDSLDTCCRVHDQCCADPKLRNNSCNTAILSCVQKANCSKKGCKVYKKVLQETFQLLKNSVCGEALNLWKKATETTGSSSSSSSRAVERSHKRKKALSFSMDSHHHRHASRS